jgi:hypothetical protein
VLEINKRGERRKKRKGVNIQLLGSGVAATECRPPPVDGQQVYPDDFPAYVQWRSEQSDVGRRVELILLVAADTAQRLPQLDSSLITNISCEVLLYFKLIKCAFFLFLENLRASFPYAKTYSA